jgi:hypothetical protein
MKTVANNILKLIKPLFLMSLCIAGLLVNQTCLCAPMLLHNNDEISCTHMASSNCCCHDSAQSSLTKGNCCDSKNNKYVMQFSDTSSKEWVPVQNSQKSFICLFAFRQTAKTYNLRLLNGLIKPERVYLLNRSLLI